ncbi:AAA family ATPase [Endozoicomonadaceae bacterium StTr2]
MTIEVDIEKHVNRRIKRYVIDNPSYKPCLKRYSNNPLTEALYFVISKTGSNDDFSKKDLFKALAKLPYHQDRDEDGSIDLNKHTHKQQSLLSMGLMDCCLPDSDLWFEIWNEITDILMDTYVFRNPLSADNVRHLTKLCPKNKKDKGDLKDRVEYLYTPRETCLTCTKTSVLIGCTGAGKTFTVESILSLIPNVIHHKKYKGQPLRLTQIPWTKIDSLPSGSEKGCCLQYLATLDYLLGNKGKDCYFKASSYNKSIDVLQLEMAIATTLHNVGMLVIDDSENILNNKEHKRLTAFLSALVNCVGLSVWYLGTTKMWLLFTSEKTKDFSAIRRIATGFYHEITRYKPEHEFWKKLVKLFWINLMVSNKVNLDDSADSDNREVSEAYYKQIYDYTQGIPAILASFMHRCNRYLINHQINEINEKVLEYVYEFRMTIIHEGINAIRGTGPNAFEDLDSIRELIEEDRRENAQYQDCCDAPYPKEFTPKKSEPESLPVIEPKDASEELRKLRELMCRSSDPT